MEKSPDERPFLSVFKLRLASANSMATPYNINAKTKQESFLLDFDTMEIKLVNS